MIAYANDHALTQDFAGILASVERLLELATPQTRAPVAVRARQVDLASGRELWVDGMKLGTRHDLAPRLAQVMERVHAHVHTPGCGFSIRWVPEFTGEEPVFHLLGIEDPAARSGTGRFGNFIQLVGHSGTAAGAPHQLMFQLALPFNPGSPGLEPFLAEADARLCCRLSRPALRAMIPTKTGSFRLIRL